MAFESFDAFVQMGNHGLYVWLCYGLFVLTIVANFFLVLQKRKAISVDVIAAQKRAAKQALAKQELAK